MRPGYGEHLQAGHGVWLSPLESSDKLARCDHKKMEAQTGISLHSIHRSHPFFRGFARFVRLLGPIIVLLLGTVNCIRCKHLYTPHHRCGVSSSQLSYLA